MAKQSNQPVVYVARELSTADYYGTYEFGYFVSKAYLKRKEIDYKPSGDIEYNHIVDFNIWPAIFAIDNNVNIHTENGDGESRSRIFKDYQSCKEYVDRLNEHRLKCLKLGKSEYVYIFLTRLIVFKYS